METFSTLLAPCVGIHQSLVNSPHKGQWHGALMFSLICAWTSGWVTNRDAGDLRCHHAHYDVTVMNLEWNMFPCHDIIMSRYLTFLHQDDRSNIGVVLPIINLHSLAAVVINCWQVIASSLTNLRFPSLRRVTHCSPVTPYGLIEICHDWLKLWLITCMLPSHYLDKYWLTTYWQLKPQTRLLWNLLQIMKFSIKSMTLKISSAKWQPYVSGLSVLMGVLHDCMTLFLLLSSHAFDMKNAPQESNTGFLHHHHTVICPVCFVFICMCIYKTATGWTWGIWIH